MFVAGGGFNYFPEDNFAEFATALPGSHPENVVLVIEPEERATNIPLAWLVRSAGSHL
jgi:hypothetical protein